MRKSKIIQFRVEECIGKELEAIVKKDDISMTQLVYSGVMEILKKKLKGDFSKLEKKIEASVKLNAKVGRKPKAENEKKEVEEMESEDKEVKKVKKEEVKEKAKKEEVKKAEKPSKKKGKPSRLAPRPAPKS